MEFNPTKCNTMHSTHSTTQTMFSYKLHNIVLQNVKEVKYLEVILDHKLSWNKHIDSLVLKANRALGMVSRNLKPAPQRIKQQAYFSLVRPHAEYASAVWDPYTNKNVRQVEMIQRRAARFVTNRYHNTSSVTDMIDSLGWQSLQSRRQISRNTLLYKTIHNHVCLPNGPEFLRRSTRQTRHSNSNTFIQYQTSTDALKYSFYPRTIVNWNALPVQVTGVATVDMFRSAVAKELR